MAAIVWADVVLIAPALSAVADGAHFPILAFVNTAFDPKVFGGEESPRLRLARMYLAAHYGTITNATGQGGGNTAGPIISETVGGVSRSYANLVGGSGSETFISTIYGRELLALLAGTSSRPGTVL